MRPFLLIATRAEDAAANAEYAAFLRYGGLRPDELHRVRLEAGPLPEFDPDAYSGVIVGGSPFTSSDAHKSDVQLRVEAELAGLLDRLVPIDYPFLGACYGIATLGLHQGGVVDTRYGEPVGPVEITVTEEGRRDALLTGFPPSFSAFVGHKEACSVLPPGAVLLASSPACPVQMFRVGQNMYATQFHPELDAEGLIVRITVYDRHGYYPDGTVEALSALARRSDVSVVPRMLRAFVTRYARE